MKEPIVAVSTPPGRGAIGIVRLSGQGVLDIVKGFFKVKGDIKPRYAHYGELVDERGEIIDEGILIFYKGPASYTGEDMVELNLHGNPLILKKALELAVRGGARLAEPGEFTKRAFLNGKMDLTQAEAVEEIISAKGYTALRSAVNQLRGELSRIIRPLRNKLVDLLSLIEADIDFGEEDIPSIEHDELMSLLIEVEDGIRSLLDTYERGRFFKEGIKLAIVGKPNVGKSSLFNTLTGKDRSIVTGIPGTTRDYIEEDVYIKGIPLILVDTAGIRDTKDPVEREGVERSLSKVEEADIVLFVFDISRGIDEYDMEIYERIKGKNVIIVGNKVDLGIKRPLENFDGKSIIMVSAITREGIPELEKAIIGTVGVVETEYKVFISVRHSVLLEEAVEAIDTFRKAIESGLGMEIAVVHLKEAVNKLGEIVGDITTEDILSNIFSKFCIGK